MGRSLLNSVGGATRSPPPITALSRARWRTASLPPSYTTCGDATLFCAGVVYFNWLERITK